MNKSHVMAALGIANTFLGASALALVLSHGRSVKSAEKKIGMTYASVSRKSQIDVDKEVINRAIDSAVADKVDVVVSREVKKQVEEKVSAAITKSATDISDSVKEQIRNKVADLDVESYKDEIRDEISKESVRKFDDMISSEITSLRRRAERVGYAGSNDGNSIINKAYSDYLAVLRDPTATTWEKSDAKDAFDAIMDHYD